MSVEESQPAQDIEEGDEEQPKPDEHLPEFDWEALEHKLQSEMHNKDEEMNRAFAEWSDLTNFFSLWFSVGNSLENNRARKRHKTQQVYVRHEEDSLEDLREGYVKVMSAFESAMEMLNRG
ncbi:hypothetical protein KVT40_008710 [Elsinoe batatas]|uniref:Uncharacterized protein n=1 Tax=Elsinoe batatas TaxID=2601811 RepID=A0A8K0KTU5_9PEZI|nr:hypothetical protein KVT40_008710 [Elsinoe batatas]